MVNPHADYNTGTTYGPGGSGITSLPQQNFGSNVFLSTRTLSIAPGAAL